MHYVWASSYKVLVKKRSPRICLGLIVDLVIQAIRRSDFEDGLWRGNHLLAGNGLQRVRTIPEINATIVPGGRVDQVPPRVDQFPTCQVPCNQWYQITAVIVVHCDLFSEFSFR